MHNFHDYKLNIDQDLQFNFEIGVDYFADLLGFSPSKNFIKLLSSKNLKYRAITQSELNSHYLNFISYMFNDTIPSGPKRQLDWETGWEQNYRELVDNQNTLDSLLPHYYRRGQNIMRFQGNFIIPEDPFFERIFLDTLLSSIKEKFLAQKSHIYEFAAGSCYNIATLANQTTDKHFFALDWAKSSQKIFEFLSKNKSSFGLKDNELTAKRFDFFYPDNDFKIEPGSLVYTFGGLEQLGTDFEALLNYFLAQESAEFLHFEPITEAYDRTTLFGEMGYQYAIKRNYLNGYSEKLQELEEKKIIEIITHKPVIGSAFHDGWTMIHFRVNQKSAI